MQAWNCDVDPFKLRKVVGTLSGSRQKRECQAEEVAPPGLATGAWELPGPTCPHLLYVLPISQSSCFILLRLGFVFFVLTHFWLYCPWSWNSLKCPLPSVWLSTLFWWMTLGPGHLQSPDPPRSGAEHPWTASPRTGDSHLYFVFKQGHLLPRMLPPCHVFLPSLRLSPPPPIQLVPNIHSSWINIIEQE